LSPSPRAVSVQRAGPCSACTTRVSGRQPASSAWGSCSGAGTDLTKMRTRRSRARRRPPRYHHTPRAASFLRAWLRAERPERLQHPQRRPARCAAGSQGRADYHVRRDKLRGLRCACPPQSARRAVCAPRGTFARSDRPGASHRGRGGARRPLQERATTPPASTSSCQSSAPGCRPPPALPRPRAPALSRGNARLQNPTKNAAESPKLDGRWKMLWTDEREVRPRPRPRPHGGGGGGGGARGVAAAAVSPSSSSSGSSGSSEGGICRGGAPDAAAARRRCCSWWRRAFSGTHASPSTRQRRARRARRKQPAGAAASPGAGLRRAGGRARVRRGAGLRRGGGLAEQRGGVRQRKPPRGAELLRAPRLTARPAPAPPRRPAPRAGARRRDAAPGAAASTSSSGRRC